MQREFAVIVLDLECEQAHRFEGWFASAQTFEQQHARLMVSCPVCGSHGVHRKHRSPGSIGGCSTPGRVFRGMRMAGRMGVDKVTVQNLTIHAVDAERGLILVRGAIPGNKGSLVVVRSAAKKGDVA